MLRTNLSKSWASMKDTKNMALEFRETRFELGFATCSFRAYTWPMLFIKWKSFFRNLTGFGGLNEIESMFDRRNDKWLHFSLAQFVNSKLPALALSLIFHSFTSKSNLLPCFINYSASLVLCPWLHFFLLVQTIIVYQEYHYILYSKFFTFFYPKLYLMN